MKSKLHNMYHPSNNQIQRAHVAICDSRTFSLGWSRAGGRNSPSERSPLKNKIDFGRIAAPPLLWKKKKKDEKGRVCSDWRFSPSQKSESLSLLALYFEMGWLYRLFDDRCGTPVPSFPVALLLTPHQIFRHVQTGLVHDSSNRVFWLKCDEAYPLKIPIEGTFYHERMEEHQPACLSFFIGILIIRTPLLRL